MHLAARTGDINVSQDLTSCHFIQEFPAKSKEATKKKKLLKPESSLMKCQTLKSVILFWHSLSRCRKTGQVTK